MISRANSNKYFYIQIIIGFLLGGVLTSFFVRKRGKIILNISRGIFNYANNRSMKKYGTATNTPIPPQYPHFFDVDRTFK